MMPSKHETWRLDQFAKSIFFHQKLHAWGLVEVAEQIETITGENLDWRLDKLNISSKAWNKIIHSGIKPVIVFAHPDVLTAIVKSVSYYRMLAMVSQKSMNQIGLRTTRLEQTGSLPDSDLAVRIAQRLNRIISSLIETEHQVDRREFDMWRGMAAGSQAQGSWQNAKGNRAENAIRNDLILKLQQSNLIDSDFLVDANRRVIELALHDGRLLRMGDEPDLAIYANGEIKVAVEIKGGIDVAGVLERVGAAIKSLRRVKEENPKAITILLMQAVSMSQQAERDILSNQDSIDYWFTIEDILEDSSLKSDCYSLMGLVQ